MCQAFATPAFDQEFRFAGSPQLRMPVLPAGPGGRVSVRLYAVGPHVRSGWRGVVVGGPASAITVNRVHAAAGMFFDPPRRSMMEPWTQWSASPH